VTTITQPIQYPVKGHIQFYVESQYLSLESRQIRYFSNQTLTETVYEIYQVPGKPAVGDVLSYQITHDTVPIAAPQQAVSGAILLIAAGGVLLVSAGSVLFWGNRPKIPAALPTPTNPETIIAQIALLDTQFEAGELDAMTYQQQRAALKAQVKQKMQNMEG
jgi:hypothetical protein